MLVQIISYFTKVIGSTTYAEKGESPKLMELVDDNFHTIRGSHPKHVFVQPLLQQQQLVIGYLLVE